MLIANGAAGFPSDWRAVYEIPPSPHRIGPKILDADRPLRRDLDRGTELEA